MVAEGNPVAPKEDVASNSLVLLEGTLAKLGCCTRKGFCLEVSVIVSVTFAGRFGPLFSQTIFGRSLTSLSSILVSGPHHPEQKYLKVA